jgi:hypothetical protein
VFGGSLNFKTNFQLWFFKYLQIKEPSVWVLWGKKIQNQRVTKIPQNMGIY